jgi:hypothetical protein
MRDLHSLRQFSIEISHNFYQADQIVSVPANAHERAAELCLLHANAADWFAFLYLYGLEGSHENIAEILQFMCGTFTNVSPQILTDASSAAASGGYSHFYIGNRLCHKFYATLAVILRLSPQLAERARPFPL